MSNPEAPSKVDHQNPDIVKMLSKTVALFNQNETQSVQDIKAKKEILNTINRFTTFPKMNPIKINELLSMILSKLKVQILFFLRAVCRHWKSVIEAICSQKKCLMLHNFSDSKLPSKPVIISNRFFNNIKLEKFDKLKLKWFTVNLSSCYNPLKKNFCTFLGTIFPNVEQLVVNLLLDTNSTQNLYNTIANSWPNLNTLSLNDMQNDFSTFRMNKLKRLDVSGKFDVPPNAELFAQLEHFSCYHSNEDSFDKMPLLGLNCTSFYWGFDDGLDLGLVVAFDRYIQRNSAQMLANITSLGLCWIEDPDQSLIRLICDNFPALRMLNLHYWKPENLIFNSATCAHLSKLSHLTTIFIGCILVDLDSLESSEIRKRLPSIRVLNLVYFGIKGTVDPFSLDFSDFDGDRFCKTLSSIFPNIEKLGILSRETAKRKIRDNLNRFGKFLKFKAFLHNFYF